MRDFYNIYYYTFFSCKKIYKYVIIKTESIGTGFGTVVGPSYYTRICVLIIAVRFLFPLAVGGILAVGGLLAIKQRHLKSNRVNNKMIYQLPDR